jgi:Nif-specific regulatory protein
MSRPATHPDTDNPESPQSYWRAQEMLLLQQVMGLIGRSLASDVVLREMLHLMSELLGLNRGRIVLRDDGTDTCSIRHAYGLTREEMARGVYHLDEGVTGTVLAREHLVIVQDIDREEIFLGRAVHRDSLPPGPVSFIALPLRIDQRTIGVLACHRIRTRTRPIADDVAMLRILATLAAQLLQLQSMLEARTRELVEQNAVLTRALRGAAARYGIIGTSPPVLRAIAELEQVSDTPASVLLLGESGTGKELFARALHLASPRRDRPFIKVNCAAIPETLFESELFGYERGAFTGAHASRAGLYEQAHQGTLFLDEIGELPLTLQGKLLRALQEGTIMHLGGKREIEVDVRVVAATNRDLETAVARGDFRQDLFYRLNVIPIRLPSLAERRSDIRALALHFLSRSNQANQRNVSLNTDALARLEQHGWPGNIRELSNLIERVVLLADRPVLDAADIERFMPGELSPDTMQRSDRLADALPGTMGAVRPYLPGHSHPPEALRDALVRCGGNKSRAAQLLGLTARQFVYRCSKLGI